jgi:hypothetical protein
MQPSVAQSESFKLARVGSGTDNSDMSLQCTLFGDEPLPRQSSTTEKSTKKRRSASRRSPSAKSTGARANHRKAAEQTGASDEQTNLPAAEKQLAGGSHNQASGQTRQSVRRRQVEPIQHRKPMPEQNANAGSKLTDLLGSRLVRNVVAAGLVSAAAALVYRKPKAFAAANESVQEAASELLSGAADAARATTKAARKVRRNATAAVKAVTKPISSAAKGSSKEQSGESAAGPFIKAAQASSTDQQRTRKRRSDAGLKRVSKIELTVAETAAVSDPELIPALGGLSDLETSVVALEVGQSQPTPETAKKILEEAPGQTAEEEQLTEARPI